MYNIILVHEVDGHSNLQNDVFNFMRGELNFFLDAFSQRDSFKMLHYYKRFKLILVKVVCMHEAIMTRERSQNLEFSSSFDRVGVIYVVKLVDYMLHSAFLIIAESNTLFYSRESTLAQNFYW